ncbi:unnamed protein product [Trichobilharzia regenti]|nr:unnamed protein product [Trichobilharzia regenti]
MEDKSGVRSQTKIPGNISASVTLNHNIISSSVGTTATRVQYYEPHTLQSQKVFFQQTHTLMSGSYVMNGAPNHLLLQQSTHDIPRSIRVERNELEREWSLVRRREDLELPDLIPLPEYTKVRQ